MRWCCLQDKLQVSVNTGMLYLQPSSTHWYMSICCMPNAALSLESTACCLRGSSTWLVSICWWECRWALL
jgi:hypothetical protein